MAVTDSMPGRRRVVGIAVAVAAVAIGVAAWWLRPGTTPEQPTHSGATVAAAPPAVPPGAPSAPHPAAAAAPADRPQFDIVRVSPGGDAVIAGRAAPGAEVVVRDGAREIGRATADPRGDFVLTPAAPLAAGPQQLTLSATAPGGAAVPGDAPVVLLVPDRAGAAATQPALAVLTPPNAAPQLLQGPGPGAGSGKTGRALGLGVVDYDEQGRIRFAGTAPPGATVRVYVDDRPVGDAVAGGDGTWTLTPAQAVEAGNHRLRIDQLGRDGSVTARIALPFQRADLPPTGLAEGHVVVQPGQNLWRLARRAYGSGVRYTVIYRANQDQIRDPRLIYPGQAFSLPVAR